MMEPVEGKTKLGIHILCPMWKVNVLHLFVASFWWKSLPVILAACCGLY